MILRPAKQDLEDTLKKITDESPGFGFLIKPTRVQIAPGWGGVNIQHISGGGPIREQSTYSKPDSPGSYNGPYWWSRMDIFPSYGQRNIETLMSSLRWTIGKPSRTTDIQDEMAKMRYDFLPEMQPERDDGVKIIPHHITFHVHRKTDRNYKRRKDYFFEFGSLDPKMLDRFLFPQPPHYGLWWESPASQKYIGEVIESRR